MKVAIIGAGSLGQSIAKGLVKTDALTSLYLTKRNIDSIKDFDAYKNVTLTSDNALAVKNSDVLIFAVQPRHFEGILKDLKPLLSENHVIISVITGFAISRIEGIVGKEHFIIRSMPNTAASVGQSMTCISANQKGKDKMRILIRLLHHLKSY